MTTTLTFAELAQLGERAVDRRRLETHPVYAVEQEAAALRAWRAGNRQLPAVEESSWLRYIRETTEAGVRWMRARILDYPLTTYSEWELYCYQANAAAGEQIFVADRSSHPELGQLHEDVWLFDDQPVVLRYAAGGAFIHAEIPESPEPYRRLWSVAMRHTMPLRTYLSARHARWVA